MTNSEVPDELVHLAPRGGRYSLDHHLVLVESGFVIAEPMETSTQSVDQNAGGQVRNLGLQLC